MKDEVSAVVTRGAESWQFFAFVLAAVAAFGLSLIEELHVALGWAGPGDDFCDGESQRASGGW